MPTPAETKTILLLSVTAPLPLVCTLVTTRLPVENDNVFDGIVELPPPEVLVTVNGPASVNVEDPATDAGAVVGKPG